MISITKDEAKLIREKFPSVGIVRTCIQKSKRHKYYMTEDLRALKLLAENDQAIQCLKERKNIKSWY